MIEVPLTNGKLLAPFFRQAYDSCPESFIQGIMGRGFCDSLTAPTYGIIQMGHYFYLSGNGNGIEKLNLLSILETMVQRPTIVLVPLSESWDQQLNSSSKYKRIIRYAMDQPKPQYFNPMLLSKYVSDVAFVANYVSNTMSRKYVMKPIDEIYYYLIQKQ